LYNKTGDNETCCEILNIVTCIKLNVDDYIYREYLISGDVISVYLILK